MRNSKVENRVIEFLFHSLILAARCMGKLEHGLHVLELCSEVYYLGIGRYSSLDSAEKLHC
jgi:hypothetical protein